MINTSSTTATTVSTEPFSLFSKLPDRAQATIVEAILPQSAPRTWRAMTISKDFARGPLAFACRCGRDVDPQEEARATSICTAIGQRVLLPLFASNAPDSSVRATVANYLGRWTTAGAREDREALLAFYAEFAEVIRQVFERLYQSPTHNVGRLAIMASFIKAGAIEETLRQQAKQSPNNLHNVLLLYNPQRTQLMGEFDRLHDSLRTLSDRELEELANGLNSPVMSSSDGVAQLVERWAQLISQAGRSDRRGQWKRLKATIKARTGVTLGFSPLYC